MPESSETPGKPPAEPIPETTPETEAARERPVAASAPAPSPPAQDKTPPPDDRIPFPRRRQAPRPPEYSAEEMQSLRRAIQESHLVQLSFYFLDYILRAQNALFEQIYSRRQLPRIIASMSLLCVLLAGIYGLVMGSYGGGLQAVASALKLPILFLLTALICVPSLYTFNVLLGQRFRFLQTAALMVVTLATTTILLVSLAPIALFFTMTTPGSYQFLLLLHVLIFGLCGVYGVRYLYRGCAYIAGRMEQPLNNLLLRLWIVIYAVVGMQLGWRLRPFVGSQGIPFEFVRSEVEGNFYIAVWRSLINLL